MAGTQYQAPAVQPQGKEGYLPQLRENLGKSEMQKKFRDILGEKAPQFMASIVNAVTRSDKLRECQPESVINAAMIAATYDLPIDANLGFSAIVPYKDKGKNVAEFQVMYRGFIQLAIRSGEYQDMNCSEVYADELLSYNPITGEVVFTDDFARTKMRAYGDPRNIIGYYAWFRLNMGFSHGLYMTRAEMENHARRYSASYKLDLQNGWRSSKWSQDFDAMAKKTVIKRLLSKWGILSIDMQGAIRDDQKVYDAEGNGAYLDNPAGDEYAQPVQPQKAPNVFAEPAQPQPQIPEQPQAQAQPQYVQQPENVQYTHPQPQMNGQAQYVQNALHSQPQYAPQHVDEAGLPIR